MLCDFSYGQTPVVELRACQQAQPTTGNFD
jgi:hypothetical protein